MKNQNNANLQDKPQEKEPNTATAVIYHVQKAARQGYIFVTVVFVTLFIGAGLLVAHLVSTNQKNNEKWIELFESYDYMSQDGEGANNINMGAQGDVINLPGTEEQGE